MESRENEGIWGIDHAVTSQQLGLGARGLLRMEWDHRLDAYVLRVLVEGTREDLRRTLYRLRWEIESMEEQMDRELRASRG